MGDDDELKKLLGGGSLTPSINAWYIYFTTLVLTQSLLKKFKKILCLCLKSEQMVTLCILVGVGKSLAMLYLLCFIYYKVLNGFEFLDA